MDDKLTKSEFIELLSSADVFENARALSLLMTARDFSGEFTDLAKMVEKKGGTIAFHIPVRSVARAYLCMAGVIEKTSLDESSLYVLAAHEINSSS